MLNLPLEKTLANIIDHPEKAFPSYGDSFETTDTTTLIQAGSLEAAVCGLGYSCHISLAQSNFTDK